MHIAILAPSHKSFISKFLPNHRIEDLPEGYDGAPFIGTIINELLNMNHKVTAITTSTAINGNYDYTTFSNLNFTWVVIPLRPHSIRFNGYKLGRILDFYTFERKEIINVLNIIKPNIVHAHWSYEFAIAAKDSGIPYLVTVHDNAIEVLRYFKNAYRFGRFLMSEYLLNQVKYTSTVSPYMYPYVSKRCDSVVVIPNPTIIKYNLECIKLIISQKTQSLINPRIIMINNGWAGRKNGKSGLLAFQLLQKKIPNATLHLFGDGSDKNGLAYEDSKNLNLENVFFYGKVSHDKILDALENAHLLIHPSFEESFGVNLIEAMSFGVPVIGGLNSGAVPWVINNENLLVDISDPFLIADKLFNILNNIEFYNSLAISSYSNVEKRFSSSSVVSKYLEYYNIILSV